MSTTNYSDLLAIIFELVHQLLCVASCSGNLDQLQSVKDKLHLTSQCVLSNEAEIYRLAKSHGHLHVCHFFARWLLTPWQGVRDTARPVSKLNKSCVALDKILDLVDYSKAHGFKPLYAREDIALTADDKTFCQLDDLVKCLPTAIWFHKEDLTHGSPNDPYVPTQPSKSEPPYSQSQLLADDDDWEDELDTRYRCNIGCSRPLPAVGTELYVKVTPFEHPNDWVPRKRFYDTFIPEKYGHINPVLYRVVERSYDNDFYDDLRHAHLVVAMPVEPGAGPECYLGKMGYAWSAKQDDDVMLLPQCHMARRRVSNLVLIADHFNLTKAYNTLVKCMGLTTVFYGDKFTPQMFRSMWALKHDIKPHRK